MLDALVLYLCIALRSMATDTRLYKIKEPSSIAKRVESLDFDGKSVSKCVLRDKTILKLVHPI